MPEHIDIPHQESTVNPGLRRAEEYGKAGGVVLLVTALALLARARLATIDVAMLFLLAIVFVASRYRQGTAVLASVLSIALFDLLFVPPYYTFGVEDLHYLLTFAVMLAVSLSMTHLTAQLREQAMVARETERRTAAVYAMDRDLRGAAHQGTLLDVASRHLGAAVRGSATVALVQEKNGAEPGPAEWPVSPIFEDVGVRVAASWAYQHGESAGNGTRHCAGAPALVVPLRGQAHSLGVVAVLPEFAERTIEGHERRTVETLAEHLVTELERPT